MKDLAARGSLPDTARWPGATMGSTQSSRSAVRGCRRCVQVGRRERIGRRRDLDSSARQGGARSRYLKVGARHGRGSAEAARARAAAPAGTERAAGRRPSARLKVADGDSSMLIRLVMGPLNEKIEKFCNIKRLQKKIVQRFFGQVLKYLQNDSRT